MSEEQSEPTTTTAAPVTTPSACPHPEAVGTRWGDPISPERQAELQALSDKQREWAARPEVERQAELKAWANDYKKGNIPFADVTLSGADVFWLAVLALASWLRGEGGVAGAVANAEEQLRIVIEREESREESSEPSLGAFPHYDVSTLHLEGANISGAHLERANLLGAHLEGAKLDSRMDPLDYSFHPTHLENADLLGAHLQGARLDYANLERASLREAHLEGASLRGAHLEGASLHSAHLKRADLANAHLEGVTFEEAHLEGATLIWARLEGTYLHDANLEGADLRYAVFDRASRLTGAVLSGASFDQVTFDNTNLNSVDWGPVDILGDEVEARKVKSERWTERDKNEGGGDSELKTPGARLDDFKAAVRANRLLAVALRNQGLNEDADRFAYRAQLLQQEVLRRQRKFGAYLFSRILDGLAGYGYKPVRGLIAYVFVILGFAVAYYLIGHTSGVIPGPVDAVVFSITSFHGRGFFPSENISLHSPVIVLAASEAIIGLLIEISFIATFTQRFFAR